MPGGIRCGLPPQRRHKRWRRDAAASTADVNGGAASGPPPANAATQEAVAPPADACAAAAAPVKPARPPSGAAPRPQHGTAAAPVALVDDDAARIRQLCCEDFAAEEATSRAQQRLMDELHAARASGAGALGGADAAAALSCEQLCEQLAAAPRLLIAAVRATSANQEDWLLEDGLGYVQKRKMQLVAAIARCVLRLYAHCSSSFVADVRRDRATGWRACRARSAAQRRLRRCARRSRRRAWLLRGCCCARLRASCSTALWQRCASQSQRPEALRT
jgi:hypothetical protein